MNKIQIELRVPVQYRRIKEFPMYAISNYGLVLNIKTGKYLNPTFNWECGYMRVNLRNENLVSKSQTNVIHRLVAKAFIPNPNNFRDVDHINRIRTNNTILNLRWVTSQQNALNANKHVNATSRYYGVSKQNKRWMAHTSLNYISKYIGSYETELEAAYSYNYYIITNFLPNQLNVFELTKE
jgi:HNH endonuclease/NUMOD4 motif-containing protein